MSSQNSFTKNQMLYNSKGKTSKLYPDKLSKYPKLGNNTVESVRDAFIKAKGNPNTGYVPKKEEPKTEAKPISAEEQYRKLQSLYSTRLNKH